jgi:hypothetical protein
MNIHHHALMIIAVTGLFAAGCSKPVTEQSGPPPESAPQTGVTRSASLPNPSTPALPPDHPPISDPVAPRSAPHMEEQLTLTQIEERYRAATTLREKIKSMRKLVTSDDPQALATLGRMFHEEKDTQMREEFLDMILDIPGKEEDKLAVLASAVTPGQPVDIREFAIDIMIDFGSKNAIPILESLLKDNDASIRDSAQDAINVINNPKPAPPMTDDDDDE